MGQTELKNMQRRANEALERWFDKAEAIEKKAVKGEELTEKETELSRWIKDLCGDGSIADHRFKLHFKTLRHTYCTELYDLGVDEVSAAAIMGHTVIIMRTIYTHLREERKAEAAKRIEGLYTGNVVAMPERKAAE